MLGAKEWANGNTKDETVVVSECFSRSGGIKLTKYDPPCYLCTKRETGFGLQRGDARACDNHGQCNKTNLHVLVSRERKSGMKDLTCMPVKILERRSVFADASPSLLEPSCATLLLLNVMYSTPMRSMRKPPVSLKLLAWFEKMSGGQHTST